MAYIADYAESAVNATSITAAMPPHATNDLLVWVVCGATDGGTDPSTPSGWTQLLQQEASGARMNVFWKIAASGSESAPSTSQGSSALIVSQMFTIKDAPTSSPFDVYASAGAGANVSAGSEEVTVQTATTTVADALLLYPTLYRSANNSPNGSPGLMTYANSESPVGYTGGASVTSTMCYSYQRSAGTTPSHKVNVGKSVARWVMATIAIKNASGGRVAGYVDDSIAAGTCLASFCFPFTHNACTGSVNPTATLTTIGDKTTVYAGPYETTDRGILPAGAIQSCCATNPGGRATNSTAGYGMVFNSQDLSSGLIAVAVWALDATQDPYESYPVATGGQFLGVGDASHNARHWQIGARDSNPLLATPTTIVIEPSSTSSAYHTTGTPPTLSAFRHLYLWSTAWQTASYNIAHLYKLGTMVLAGGTSAIPFGADDLEACGRSFVLPLIIRYGATLFEAKMPVQVGGGDAIYLDWNGLALNFPTRASSSNKFRSYHASANKVGISYYGKSGDTIRHTNAIVASESEYYWTIHASATSAATWDFNGLTVIGANVTLRDVTTFRGMTFSGCTAIDASACDLVGCTINDTPAAGGLLTVTSATTFSGCTFDTTGITAGNSLVSTAYPNIFADSTFNGSGSTGHAIRITAAGTYTLDGNTFAGYGADGSTSAAIFNDSGGAVTINVTGGGSTPTIRNGSGASTTVNNAVTLTVTVVDATGTPISGARVLLKKVTGGTTVLSGTTGATGIKSDSYNYTADAAVTGWVRLASSAPYYRQATLAGTITATGYAATAVLAADQ